MTPLVVGAAMHSALLDTYLDWILAEQRDLEIQDAVSTDMLDGDWQTHASTIKARLNGHTGRLGIHGPFWSLPTAAQDPAIREVVVRRLKQGIEFCAAVGGSHIVVHSPFYTSLGKPFTPYVDNVGHEFQLDLAHKTLDEVVPVAADAGVTLMIEGIHDLTPGPAPYQGDGEHRGKCEGQDEPQAETAQGSAPSGPRARYAELQS